MSHGDSFITVGRFLGRNPETYKKQRKNIGFHAIDSWQGSTHHTRIKTDRSNSPFFGIPSPIEFISPSFTLLSSHLLLSLTTYIINSPTLTLNFYCSLSIPESSYANPFPPLICLINQK